MKNLSTYSFVMFFFVIAFVQYPVKANEQYAPRSLSLTLQHVIQPDKATLAQLCDSLVLANDYNKIINYCVPYASDSDYKETVIPYLIAAYYFTGDSIQSNRMLATLLNGKSYEDIFLSLISSNVALIKYFDIEQNRKPVVALALKQYKTTGKATRKQEGEQVIRFLINDQRIRKLKYAYKKESPEFLEQLSRRFTVADSTQNEHIYSFYKKHGRYFSAKEVGESVSSMQLIYFSHITDIELRQSFFKPILEKAVEEGAIDKESLVNFILRTESFVNPDFWNTINDRMPEIRKQYDLPDNYIWTPF
ncbi:MAG: hypothetical protein JNM21_14325 [Taibaiella sp.]|nr:hypothetical protein [Taibaiella sp.]